MPRLRSAAFQHAALPPTSALSGYSGSGPRLGVVSRGFTLIELLVAVAILALISLLAYPLYTSYSQRAWRAEAQSDLMVCALGMERRASEEFSYEGAADTDGDGSGDADSGAVAATVCSARSIERGHYSIEVDGTAEGFVLTARPLSGGPMAGDGFLAIDAAGNRQWDRDDSGAINSGEDLWD